MNNGKKKIQINFSCSMTLILIILMSLKIADIITWSWWWVLSPLWLPWTLLGLAVLVLKLMSYLLLRNNPKYFM